MMKRETTAHDRVHDIEMSLSTAGRMSWAERQHKTLEMQRFFQHMTRLVTVDFQISPAYASPILSKMFEAFRGQDAYGIALHMDAAYLHVFLVGTDKRLEYLRYASAGLEECSRDLVKHLMTGTAIQGPPKNFESGPSRKMHLATLASRAHTQDCIEDCISRVLRVIWEVIAKPILKALQLEVSQF
jgi:hypothetical protein